MPPKRKRTGADTPTAGGGSTARSTKKSSGTTRGKADVKERTGRSNSVEPPPKKTRARAKKSGGEEKSRGTESFGTDDEPLNSTNQQHSDDELDVLKEAPATTEYSPQRAQALFKRFADDEDPDVISPGGVENLCKEAGIPLEGAQPLILAWQFKAQEVARLSRSEWIQGSEALRISSLPVLAIALKELDDLIVHDKEPFPLSSSAKKRDGVNCFSEAYNKTRYKQYASNRNTAFTELYHFSFVLSKSQQSRNLDMETALALWSVLLVPRYPIIAELIVFLGENPSYKGVNKDIWKMVLEFCQTIAADFGNYESEGAWPTMLDDFAVWKRNTVPRSSEPCL